jgi:magnesium transporter
MKKLNFKSSDELLKKTLKTFFAYDLAVLYPDLHRDEQKRLLSLINLDKLSDMFVELDYEDQIDLLDLLEITRRKSLLKNLESDDLKEFFEELDDDLKEIYISYLPKIKAKTLHLLLQYDEDLAASIMTTDFILISQNESIKDATNKIITMSKDNDYIDTIYIIDDDKKIVGAIDLRQLIMARPQDRLEDIMLEDLHYVYEDESIEKAIQTVSDYDRNVIPVLDKDDHVIGIVTADDIFDEIIEDTEYDYQKMALLQDHDSQSTAFTRSKQRLPWLMIAVVLNLFIAVFLSIFEATLIEVTALVLFQPLILGMAGNIGTQSLAVTILGLHLKDIEIDKLPKKHVIKEIFVGLMNSFLLGIASFVFATIFLTILPASSSQLSYQIGFVVFLAVFVSMFISALIGVFVPIILTKFNQDPAAASGPIMTTINDLIALVIYFGVATIAFL